MERKAAQQNKNILEELKQSLPTMHFIGRVTMLFANNSLMECLITMKFLHIFFYTLTKVLVHIPCLLMLPQKSLLL